MYAYLKLKKIYNNFSDDVSNKDVLASNHLLQCLFI